jgi:hypothetical protein
MNWCSHRIQNEVLFPALSRKKTISVQKCQAKGQKLKLLRMKVWNIVNLLNLALRFEYDDYTSSYINLLKKVLLTDQTY